MSVFSAMGFYGDLIKFPFPTKSLLVLPNDPPTPIEKDKPGVLISEGRFLIRATRPKEFFENAVKHLKTTVTDKKPIVIGIQEFDPPTLGMIMSAVNEVNPDLIGVPFTKDLVNNAKVLTIYNRTLLGDIARVYEADLGNTEGIFTPATEKMPNDSGRPIQIIITTRGFIIMNFHGPNRPRLVASPVDVADLLKPALEKHAAAAGILDMDLNKLIITCDSNDRGHKINGDSPLMLNGVKFHDGHGSGSGAATSCCYNLDSCGIDEPAEVVEGGKIPKDMGAMGAESKYIYTGDYILSANIVTPVTAIDSPQDDNGASVASDHKLVFAEISLPMAGGRRRKGRKTQKKAGKKAKKSRKVKRRNH